MLSTECHSIYIKSVSFSARLLQHCSQDDLPKPLPCAGSDGVLSLAYRVLSGRGIAKVSELVIATLQNVSELTLEWLCFYWL